MLAKRFEHILHDLGMAGLEHPLFYHAPVGIRFKIGGEEPIYLDRRAAKLKTNPRGSCPGGSHQAESQNQEKKENRRSSLRISGRLRRRVG